MYPYFLCAGRHGKRVKDCGLKSILIEEIERSVELVYDNHNLEPKFRELLESGMSAEIEKSQKKLKSEQIKLRREKEKLEHKRKKLPEAHYNDAIPLELMRSEQAEIEKALAGINYQLKAHDNHYGRIMGSLNKALDMIENCGRTYRFADEYTKKILN